MGEIFSHQKIVVLCDNLAVCIALNTGKAKCTFLQSCLREICFVAALNEFEIRAKHLFSEENRISDCLSRFHKGPKYRDLFFQSVPNNASLVEHKVTSHDFKFMNNW